MGRILDRLHETEEDRLNPMLNWKFFETLVPVMVNAGALSQIAPVTSSLQVGGHEVLTREDMLDMSAKIESLARESLADQAKSMCDMFSGLAKLFVAASTPRKR